MKSKRQLRDLGSVGSAMLRDLEDICVLDVFRCAVAQAKNPRLPAAQRNWWYWSRLRKSGRR